MSIQLGSDDAVSVANGDESVDTAGEHRVPVEQGEGSLTLDRDGEACPIGLSGRIGLLAGDFLIAICRSDGCRLGP